MRLVKKVFKYLVLILGATSLVFLGSLWAAISYEPDLRFYTVKQVTEVFDKVKKNNGLDRGPYPVIIIRVEDSPIENAWIQERIIPVVGTQYGISLVWITVTTGMLKVLENDHQLASLLGHEYAHYLLRHTSANTWRAVEGEVAADHYGNGLAAAAGYDVCYIHKMWAKFAKDEGDNAVAVTHPLSSDRAKYLKCTPKLHNIIKYKFLKLNYKFHQLLGADYVRK